MLERSEYLCKSLYAETLQNSVLPDYKKFHKTSQEECSNFREWNITGELAALMFFGFFG